MPDFDTAMEVIDFYTKRYVQQPQSDMPKTDLRLISQRLYAIDILKEHLKIHWFEAPPADLIYNFIKEYKRRNKAVNGDDMLIIIYKTAKEIFYYFI